MTLVIDLWPTSQPLPLSSQFCTFKSQKHFISIPSSFPNSIFKIHLAWGCIQRLLFYFEKTDVRSLGFPRPPRGKKKGIILRKSAVWSLLISQHFFLFDAGIRTCGFAGFPLSYITVACYLSFFPFFSCAGLRVSIGHILFSFPPFLFP